MRLEDLKDKSDTEQNEMIVKCQKCSVEEVLNNPKLLEKKVLVFRGNYDGFATDRLCVRTLEYITSEDRWKISDVILYKMSKTEYWHHFTKYELEVKFGGLCRSTGFVMEL